MHPRPRPAGGPRRKIPALLQALEPLGGPAAPACSVSVHDRRIELALDPSAGNPRHHALVQAGRLVGAVENTLRALGWAPRTVIADTPDARPLAVVAGTRRRPAAPMDLARRRVNRCQGTGTSPRYAAPADQARVVDVAHAAGSRGAWLHLLNGPTHDGNLAWHSPGSVPADTLTLDLPGGAATPSKFFLIQRLAVFGIFCVNNYPGYKYPFRDPILYNQYR